MVKKVCIYHSYIFKPSANQVDAFGHLLINKISESKRECNFTYVFLHLIVKTILKFL